MIFEKGRNGRVVITASTADCIEYDMGSLSLQCFPAGRQKVNGPIIVKSKFKKAIFIPFIFLSALNLNIFKQGVCLTVFFRKHLSGLIKTVKNVYAC